MSISATPSDAATRPDDYSPERHVYEPHRAGMPKFGPYVRQLWHRRSFLWELSRSNLRTANQNTALGQLWLVLNPLLLGAVYFLLVNILRGGEHPDNFFPHLLAGLFAYYFVSGSMTAGARSVTSGGRLILNTAFPRLLLPLSSTLTAFLRFLPTLVVYAVVHVVNGVDVGPHLLLAVPMIVELALFAAGAAFLVATLHVYFRDTAAFLPYFVRIWLYLSPVLYFPEQMYDRLGALSYVNPLYFLLGGWTEVLVEGTIPSATMLLGGAAWSVGLFVIGATFLVSREREFAVRL
ncbi:ABC transporter permease [Motilibacter deserti]|uniref:Transport permease protein n=1 Tax=Motilibacter deserti TaxID=2714956 RepID=A0ABX0GWX7_9ACTN|nr:ABC transporter permease [Motilibacter deserti]NHC15478.1 ABC transporter permease [Motilibacter deserti]